MKALIVVIKEAKYLLDITNVERIIQKTKPTYIPNADFFVDGFIEYNNLPLKLVNLRKLLNVKSMKEEEVKRLEEARVAHTDWVHAIEDHIEKGSTFTKTVDPKACAFGKWMVSMDGCIKCDNKGFKTLLHKAVSSPHESLHKCGKVILETHDKNEKLGLLRKIEEYYATTMKGIDTIEANIDLYTDAIERIIIYRKDNLFFGLVVDNIDKMVELDDNKFSMIKANSKISSKIISDKSAIIENQIMLYLDFDQSLFGQSAS